MKKYLALILVIAVLSAVFVSCGDNNTPVYTTDGTETAATSDSVVTVITATDLYPFDAQLLTDENGEVTGAAVKEWKSRESSIVIPSEITYEGKTYPITMVGYYFTLVKSSPASVTSVSIPASVKTVSTRAFTNFTSLSSVSFAEGLETIEDMAFWKCISLGNVTLPSTLKTIGANAFSDCRTMTSVVIPADVTYIGTGAFAGCTGLTDVTLPAIFRDRVADIFANCGTITYHFN